MPENIYYTYKDIYQINSERKYHRTMFYDDRRDIIEIYSVNFDTGLVEVINYTDLRFNYHIDTVERFLYRFITGDFVIEYIDSLENYNFDNLRLYTHPDEFLKDLGDFVDNAMLLGADAIFNSFILSHTLDGFEVIGYYGEVPKTIIFPEFVTAIGANAFYNQHWVSEIELTANIKRIGANAFNGCRSLNRIELPENIEYMEDGAFANTGIESVVIPKNITVIEKGVFKGCYSLRNVSLPDTLKIIKDEAFMYSSTKNLNIPSAEEIGRNAFYDNHMENDLYLPVNLRYGYYSAFCMPNLRKIYIPKEATIVDDADSNKYSNYPKVCTF